MDDIFDNLIYIIIMIVVFVISAIGKNKKKQAQRSTVITESDNNKKEDSPFSFNNIEKLIKEEKPEIAHLHNIAHQISPAIINLLKKNNIPIVQTLHDYKLICP